MVNFDPKRADASLSVVTHDESLLNAKLRALLAADPVPDGVLEADLTLPAHADAVLRLLNIYAKDPIANGAPLAAETERTLIGALRAHPTTLVFLAFEQGVAVGMALCFMGFSSFAARPLINIHDLIVTPTARGKGLGRHLIAAVEQKAVALNCVKLTLEVMSNNAAATALYEKVGFRPYALSANKSTLVMLEKKV